MSVKLIHSFASNTDGCFDTCLVQGQQDILGVLSSVQIMDEEAKPHWLIELALINLSEGRCERIIAYNRSGPGEDDLTFDAILRYDLQQKRWVIAQVLSSTYVAMRTLKITDDGNLTLSPLCLLQTEAIALGGIDPLLDLEIRVDCYRFFYLRAFTDHLWTPRIGKTDVAVWDAWDGLMEWMATERSGDETGYKNWKEWLHTIGQQSSKHKRVDRIFLPEQVTFDPHTVNASQTSDIEVIHQNDLVESETALTIANQSTRLLALCTTEGGFTDMSVYLPARKNVKWTPRQWRIWLSEWDRDSLDYKWAYTPDIGVPFDNNLIGSGDNFPLPTAYITTLIGPDTTQQEATFVALMILSEREKDIFQPIGIAPEEVDDDDDNRDYELIRGKPIGPLQSRGVCLDTHGQVVQEIHAPFGLRPSLCRCEDLIVGVDQLAENWRLWNWAATQEDHLRNVLLLDPDCRSAYVRSQVDATTFWLIEEVAWGVRISKRDATTLVERMDGQILVGTRLLRESDLIFSTRERPLDPQRNPGLIPYQDTLLVLVMNAHNAMEFYQVQ